MSVFDDFPSAVTTATYYPTNMSNPLGPLRGAGVTVSVIVDEGGQITLQSPIPVQTDDVLFYCRDAPLDSHACVGGIISYDDGTQTREFRVLHWDVARDQDTGMIDHYEIYGQEVSS